MGKSLKANLKMDKYMVKDYLYRQRVQHKGIIGRME